ncbi:hypothetical protein QAD02_022842 [Eretmocerus hayati]|uniref:Uncharacterized protein n=1 Tax=Eretmocerus hayati TaxID=131215 RepID=A0ACC2PVA6_9HYME|nr:hypothetical protein QAD02_022842 [Eretmocerus hayati]
MKICGGIAISPNEVITSASCLSPSSSDSLQIASFGSATTPFSREHAVINKCIPGNFDFKASDHTNDIAVLHLREPLVNDFNKTIESIDIAEADLKLDNHTTMQVVGYIFYPKGNSDRSIKISSISLSRKPGRRKTNLIAVRAGDLSNGLGACYGNGGVSAFVGNKLVGLTTKWEPDCKARPGSFIMFTSIADNRVFIDQCLAKFRNKDQSFVKNKDPSFAHTVKELLWSFTIWG